MAWALWGLSLACVVATIVLTLGPGEDSLERESGALVAVVLAIGPLAFPTVGALIVSRSSDRNTIGLLLLLGGSLVVLGILMSTYAGVIPARPGQRYAAWLQHWTIQSPAVFSLFTFLLLLFPTGRTLNARWARVARVAAVASGLYAVLAAFKPGRLAESTVTNPFGVAVVGEVWTIVELPLFFAIVLCVPASAVSFVLRFRRSRGVERQQMRWFAAAAVLMAAVGVAAPIVFSTPAIWWLWPILFVLATTSLPVAAGIAVLRYRLYDIDRVISRTVSYAIVTAVLVGVYAVIAVLVPSMVFGGRSSDLTIAAGTLGAAAAFGPVRRVVQTRVDRRFNRARYDAEGTVEEFTVRLREQIDLDSLSMMLESVVDRTVQPAHLFLWISSRATAP